MALLTPVTNEDARRLGALYGLRVISSRGILAGSVNTSVELVLEDKSRAFLRIYEEQGAASAEVEARLLAHLEAHGVPTPRPLSLVEDGARFIASHVGKPAAVFPWVDGEMVCQASVTPEVAAEVGEAVARVHVAGASFAGAPAGRFGPRDLADRLSAARAADLPATLREVTNRLADRLDRTLKRSPGPEGAGLVHGDLFRENVLFRGGHIAALLDFESASRESYAFDLMVTILAWCFGDRLDPALARAMAQGYARVRPLPEAEARSLHEEGTFAALRFSITRITDFEMRPRGTSVFKDYRRFLARLSALDALGPEGLRAMLDV